MTVRLCGYTGAVCLACGDDPCALRREPCQCEAGKCDGPPGVVCFLSGFTVEPRETQSPKFSSEKP